MNQETPIGPGVVFQPCPTDEVTKPHPRRNHHRRLHRSGKVTRQDWLANYDAAMTATKEGT